MKRIIPEETINLIKNTIPTYTQHGQYQMCLGSLIKALQRERVGLPVVLSSVYQGYEDKYPGTPHSYHGHSSDLAFTPSIEVITIAEFFKVCNQTLMQTFPGIAGDFTMIHNTPLWISTPGIASKNGIVDVVPTDGHITLITKTINEE